MSTKRHESGVRPGVMADFSWAILIAPTLALLTLLFIFPVAQVLWLSFYDPAGNFTISNYEKLAATPAYLQSLWVTFELSASTTLLCILIGYPVAYLLVSVKTSLSRKLLILVLIPFWTSFLVRSFAWMVLLGRQGAINNVLMSLGIIDQPLSLIYNHTGALIGMVHVMLPLFVLVAAPVMSRIDKNLMNAAATLGAGVSQSFWRIFFPLSLPGVAGGGILIFVTSLGFFITPGLLGGRHEMVISRIIVREIQEGVSWGFASALSVLLLVATVVFFILYDRLVGLSSLSGGDSRRRGTVAAGLQKLLAIIAAAGDIMEKAYRHVFPVRADRPALRTGAALLWTAAALALLFLVLPILFIIPVSFTKQSFIGWPPDLFSWQWYERFASSPLWSTAMIRSIAIGIGTGILATVLGTLAAYALVSRKMRWRAFWLGLVISPMMVPNVVIGVAIFYLFAPLKLIGSGAGLALAHTVIALPYVVVTVLAVLKGYDERLNQAAWTMGAGTWQTFKRIQLPLIQTGIFAAFLFAFVKSFDDLTIALFVTAGLTSTLPKEMWDAATTEVNPELAAVSTVTLFIVLAVIIVAERLQSRGALHLKK